MKAPRALLLAVALAAASPAIAQTTGSESCTTLIQSAANAASSRVSADDTDIPKPQSVKNFTCLDKFFNGTGLNVVVNLLNPTTLLNAVESEICNKLTSIWQSTIGKAQCGITLTGFKMGFLGGSTLGGGLSCPKISIGGGGPTIMSIGVGSTEQRQNLDHRQRRRPDRLLHHIPSWPLLRAVSMPKSRFLLSSASGVLVRRARVRGLARLRPDRRLRLGEQRGASRHQSDRADDVEHAQYDHGSTDRDRTARDLAGERPVRKRDRASATGLYPERQLRQGASRRAEPDRRWRADLERPLPARHPQRRHPRRAHDEFASLRRPRQRPDRHRQRRPELESHPVHPGRRRHARRGGPQPACLLRTVASGRGDRAAAFRPLLLAARGDGRPLLPLLDPERRPARLDPVRNRHSLRPGGRDGRQRLCDQPRPADRPRRVARRPIDLGSRPRRQHSSPRLQREDFSRAPGARLCGRHPVPLGAAEQRPSRPRCRTKG